MRLKIWIFPGAAILCLLSLYLNYRYGTGVVTTTTSGRPEHSEGETQAIDPATEGARPGVASTITAARQERLGGDIKAIDPAIKGARSGVASKTATAEQESSGGEIKAIDPAIKGARSGVASKTATARQESSGGEIKAIDPTIKELRSMLANVSGDQRARPVKLPPAGDTVHICIAAGNKGVIQELSVLLKSLFLLAETREVFLHLLVNEGSRPEISSFLSADYKTFVPFQYEMKTLNETWVLGMLEEANIGLTHFSGIFGMSKVLFYLIWENVDRCLIIDTDLVFGTDPAYLWYSYADMEPSSLVMMQLNQTNEYVACSCVMLQKFQQMRQSSFFEYVKPLVPKYCKREKVSQNSSDQHFRCGTGDQTLYHGVSQQHKELYTNIDPSWNLENCHRFHNVDFRKHLGKSKEYFFGIAHFNCVHFYNENAFHTFVKRNYGNVYLASYIDKIASLNGTSFYSAKHIVRNVGELFGFTSQVLKRI